MTRKPNSLWIGICAAAALLAAAFAHADDANLAKARSLVDAAIQLTDSNQALKMLWQATEIDPTFNESYVYLGLYYNSREDFPKVVEVYQRLVKYQPGEVSAYLNIGEAYMSFNPPRFDQAEIPPKLCLLCAGGKRALGFTRRKGSNGDSDAPHAEVALGVEVAGRRAPDRGMAGNIDCVGD